MNLIRIDFSFQTRHGEYRDCLILPEDHTLSNDQLNDLKQARVEAWLNFVDSQSSDPGTSDG